ncbi:hypothetical protein POTOM_004553 [Populus tomentosa]|uniref:CBF1-interacting co-repressor CIR N-terminal domain-containing protein n=1 Tax=Populus tomentosa TaxID=118781 RepID=A0A8X8AKF2_POPTO|nr:hypothetical protein POTOM_004553 [Populus tomentosa]
MGGHGGLNILPQKKWNVYNYENREKVRKDEEAAARDEQLKREEVRKRDAEFRLERLRAARGLPPMQKPEEPVPVVEAEASISEPKSNHINLFEGIKIFDPVMGLEKERGDEGEGSKKKRKMMKKEEVRIVTAEDEKYRLGYGVAGKGVKLPWYLERRSDEVNNKDRGEDDGSTRGKKEVGKKSGKKTLEELRDERLKREKHEKERERALLVEKSRRDGSRLKEKGFSRSFAFVCGSSVEHLPWGLICLTYVKQQPEFEACEAVMTLIAENLDVGESSSQQIDCSPLPMQASEIQVQLSQQSENHGVNSVVLFTIIHDFAPASSKWCRSVAGKSLDDEGDAFYPSGQREQRKSLLCYLYLYLYLFHVFRLVYADWRSNT